jgi:hypothetical protein
LFICTLLQHVVTLFFGITYNDINMRKVSHRNGN